MRLNLGCADRVIDGYIGVDIAPPADQVCDLAEPWPWDDSSVEEVLAYDVIEHIRTRILHDPFTTYTRYGVDGRIHFMNQLHRVLVPDGRATIETPNAAHGVGYYQDPTHCSPWVLSTFKYFEHGAFANQRLAKAYGIRAAFRVVNLIELQSNGENPAEHVWKIRAVLEAVK